MGNYRFSVTPYLKQAKRELPRWRRWLPASDATLCRAIFLASTEREPAKGVNLLDTPLEYEMDEREPNYSEVDFVPYVEGKEMTP